MKVTISYSDGTKREIDGVGSYWIGVGQYEFFASTDYSGEPFQTASAGPRLGDEDDPTPRVTAITES